MDTTSFTIGRRADSAPAEFYLQEKCWHEYHAIDSVRGCLESHRRSLLARMSVLDAILASKEPENAERLLFDSAGLQVNEITLRSPATPERFHAMMRDFWNTRG